jgi:ABC-type lipoprotein release transport system permease subunit
MRILLALVALLAAGQAAAQAPLPGILVERRLAAEARLSVGDTVQARALAGEGAGGSFVVEGIFERAADPARISRNAYEVRFHLADLEAMLPANDRVDRFAVVLRPGASADSAARWMEGLAYGTRAYGSAELAEESSTTFKVISRFHRAIGVVTVLASGIFLLCVMIIRVDERRRDVGVMRLIGISRWTVFRAVVLEAIGIAAVGSVIGMVVGMAISQVVNAYYASVYDTTLRFALLTPRIVLGAGVLGLALGVGAGVLAALRIVRVAPQRLGER